MILSRNTGRPRPDIGLRVLETMTSTTDSGHVCLVVFPLLLVSEIEGSYQVAPISALTGIPDDSRRDDGTYQRGSYKVELGSYRTEDRGLEGVVDRRATRQFGGTTEAMMFTAAMKTKEMMRAHEARCAKLALDTNKFANAAATAKWNTANAKPRDDVRARKVAMRAKGITPNQMVITYDQYLVLQGNADVQAVVYQLFPDAAKDGQISLAHLERYFDLPIAVAGAQFNSKPAGEASALASIWDSTKVWIGRVRKTGGTSYLDYTDPHVGNTFLYNEGQSIDAPWLAEDYPDEPSRSDIVRVRADMVAAYLQSLDDQMQPLSEVYKACGNIIHTVL